MSAASDPTGLPAEYLAITEDPESTAGTLRALFGTVRRQGRWKEQGRQVLEAVMRHPNAPPDLLCASAVEFPAAFCANPALPLIVLESPYLIGRIDPSRCSSRLLSRPDLPPTVAHAIAACGPSKRLREEASLHIAAGGEVPDGSWRAELRGFLKERFDAATNPLTAEERTAAYVILASCGGPAAGWFRRQGEDNDLADSPVLALAELGVRHPTLFGPAVLLRQAHPLHRPEDRHTWDPAGDDGHYRRDGDWWARLGSALNPYVGTAARTLAMLSEDTNRWVRGVARARLRREDARPGAPVV